MQPRGHTCVLTSLTSPPSWGEQHLPLRRACAAIKMLLFEDQVHPEGGSACFNSTMKKGEAGVSGIQASFRYKENYLTAKTKTPPHTRRLYTLISCMGFSCGDIVGNMLMSVRVRGDGVVVGSATQAMGEP